MAGPEQASIATDPVASALRALNEQLEGMLAPLIQGRTPKIPDTAKAALAAVPVEAGGATRVELERLSISLGALSNTFGPADWTSYLEGSRRIEETNRREMEEGSRRRLAREAAQEAQRGGRRSIVT